MNELQNFDFNGSGVRVITDNPDSPLWIASDVAKVLGYSATAAMTRTLDADEKGVHNLHTLGGVQEVTVITESGLYAAILKSRRPEATEFRRWVTREVLPSIRKRGGYLTPEATEKALTDPDFIIRLATELKEEQSKRKELEEKRAIDAPKVEYHDRFISEDSDVFTIDDWAAQYGLRKGEGLRLLREKKIIYRKAVTSEFSKKKEELVERLEHRAYVHHRQLFDLRPQLKAPRYNNGQMRQTLYVKVACSTQLAHLAGITTTALEGI